MVGRRGRPFEGAVESLFPVVRLTGAIWDTRESEGPEGTSTEIGSASFGAACLS